MAGLVRGIFGVRDYRYASLDEIVEVIREFGFQTREAVQLLDTELKNIELKDEDFKDPSSVVRLIHHWTYILESFDREFKFLTESVARGIQQSHLDRISKIYAVSHEEADSSCAEFDTKHLQLKQNEREADLAVERIYNIAQGQFIDYFDLSGMIARLREFSGQAQSLPVATNIPTGEIRVPEQEHHTQDVHFEVPEGSNWGDVVLQFVGLDSLHIRVGSAIKGTHSFVELKFEDGRKADKEGHRYPNKQWNLLMLLSETGGSLSWNIPGVDKTFKKTISLLRKDLKRLFPGIKDEDPFSPYDKRRCYEAKFTVRPLAIHDD
jgi:hypothetical protein